MGRGIGKISSGIDDIDVVEIVGVSASVADEVACAKIQGPLIVSVPDTKSVTVVCPLGLQTKESLPGPPVRTFIPGPPDS